MEKVRTKKNVSEKVKTSDTEKDSEKNYLFDLLIHDITEPLSIVSTSTNNLLHRADRYGSLTDPQRRLMERILKNVDKAQNLIQEIIEVLRSEEGFFKKEYFSVENTFRESLLDVLEMTVPDAVEKLYQVENPEAFRHALKEYGIFVEITGKYSKAPFYHDQRKIQQIFRNLISNAVKYRRECMRVKISGEVDLVILVEDDGIGIPLDQQKIIFEPFVRLNDKRHAYVSGLGLGLTGVKTLVEALGGDIILESGEGTGTRFIIRIPTIQS